MGLLGSIAGIAGGGLLDAYFGGQQASKNREFQNQMSSTAHQREVHDLKLAGLNPILSAGGRGASSPSGSMAPGTGFAQAASGISAQSIQRQQMKATVDNTEANTLVTQVNAKFQKEMLDYFDNLPKTMKDAVRAGMLTDKAGMKRGPVGAVLGGASSAIEALKKGTTDRVDKAARGTLNQHYGELNREPPSSIDWKSSPQYRGPK